jgi:exosortase
MLSRRTTPSPEGRPVAGEATGRDAAPAVGVTVTSSDLLFATAAAAACCLVMIDAWRDVLRLGTRNEELSYVLLAPLVITWTAWSRRSRLARCSVRGGWVGLLILAAGYATYWYGFLTDPVLWRAGAVVSLVGAVVAVLGSDVLLRFAPAFAAAVFLIPVSPDGRYRLAAPLQAATATATQAVCDVLGINVDRAGNLLTINNVDVTVAEACNGMRMILTLFLVCYTVAFTVPLRTPLRVALLAASPVVAVACNIARLVPTVWLFGHSSTQVAEGFHQVSGWVMTVLAFLGLMGGLSLVRRWSGAGTPQEQGRTVAAVV